MPRLRRRRQVRRYGAFVLGMAIFVWTGFQWYELRRMPRWTLHSFDRKNMVWTNRMGEVLFVTAAGQNLSGYQVIPEEKTVTFRDVQIAYQRVGGSPLQPQAGAGNLFDDLSKE